MAEDVLTQEEKQALEQDIADAKKSLSDRDKESAVAAAKAEGRQEAEKEAELKRKLEEQERARQELEGKIKSYEEASAKQNEDIKKQLDELRESKMVVEPENPFAGNQAQPNVNVDAMSEEDINDIERESCEAFLEARSRGGNF